MIDLQLLRAQPERYQQACAEKRINFDVQAFLSLDAECRELRTLAESMRAELNALSKEVPKLQGEEQEKRGYAHGFRRKSGRKYAPGQGNLPAQWPPRPATPDTTLGIVKQSWPQAPFPTGQQIVIAATPR